MRNVIRQPQPQPTGDRCRNPRQSPLRSGLGSIALVWSLAAGVVTLGSGPVLAPNRSGEPAAWRDTRVDPPEAPAKAYSVLLDPRFSLGTAPVTLTEWAPLPSSFEPRAPTAQGPAVPQQIAQTDEPLPLSAPATVSPLVDFVPPEDSVPMPPQRPPSLLEPAGPKTFRSAARQIALQTRGSAPAAKTFDDRSFFEKFFGGLQQPAGPALGYAAPEDSLFDGPRRLTPDSTPSHDQWTAVYDIAGHTVILPNGIRLEAHSGLGDRLDDPRYVHERMRGPTPPHLYDLTPREQLFHGVQALRLNPVGGGSLYGRTGLLAHSFMLGPNGDSNGCVSFRNYNAFLEAYHTGQVKRLMVVARQS